ncbi:hypothetical protein SCRM01_106c [Synechococcus phage S-CRM01]|nr:hypothetical protein SCRM01_106c [Synechococcus phage S-CRM01]AEC53052.1 hypothetical protein SCRM01_106c [Synechococcus phage S-CRM01]
MTSDQLIHFYWPALVGFLFLVCVIKSASQ